MARRDVYIVSDVHGDHKALVKALYGAELFDNHGQKDPNAFIVQLGDLANCVADSVDDDIHCLGFVGNEIDLMLVGNHEIPYFDGQNRFRGFHWNDEISKRLWDLREEKLLQAACVFNNTLVTHAGITAPQMPAVSRFDDGMPDAHDMALQLNNLWLKGHFEHRLFSDIGKARYGTAEVGGALWCDFDREFKPTNFAQVVGHTARGLQKKGNTLCIDTIRHTGRPTILKLGE